VKLRINLYIPESFPLLHAEIEHHPVAFRAERMRQLATIGLLVCHGTFAPASPTDTPSGGRSNEAEAESAAAIRGLLEGF